MRSPSRHLRTCCFVGVLVVLGAIACASEPSPASSDASSDSGAPATGSTTHETSTSAAGSSTSVDSSTSTSIDATTTSDTFGTTSPDPSAADDFPVPDLGGPQPSCHPLEPDCPETQGCYPIDGIWQCVPDASGDTGAYGDPCDSDDGCDPGFACLNPNALPPGLPCEGAAGCCTVLCDFSDPGASLTCPSAAEGQLCLPWYPAGEAPRGYEDVGACSLWP